MTGSVALKLGSVFSNFDANLLASKFGIFANKLAASTTPTEITDGQTGTWLLWLMDTIIRFVYYLIYSVCRFALNFVDFCEVLVNKLSGIAGQNKSYSPQADFDGNPIFRFLTHDAVLTTFLIMVGVAILIVIILSIIAIVKNEYDAYSDDKDNGKGPIIRRALKSCFLFVVAPIFLFIFVFASNAVLNSVNQAFKQGVGNYSLGGQIFVSSTYSANRYRNYAARGTRAPITFNFMDPASTGFVNVMTAEEIANQYASWGDGKKLYNAFAKQEFNKFNDTIIYKNNKLYNSSSYSDYENFVTTAEEYYVMADFLDYAVGNSLEFYIKAMSDSDIDWETVKSKIGASQYYSILNNLTFSIPYTNVSGIGDMEYYIKEYVNANGTSMSPLSAALSSLSQVLAIGEYSGNTFRCLERVNGFTNYVRWRSENAIDAADGSILRVYKITKYTYNTTIQELQNREPITVVLKNGVYYDARKITDITELEAAGGAYSYKTNTSNLDSKVDRVPQDHVFTYDDGTEYRDNNNQPVIIPKDKLEVVYKMVSWPEKLYNDLMIIYSDINIDNIIAEGKWDSIVTSAGISGNMTGSINIPTAFISPMGLMMSELFLGSQLENEQGKSLSDFYYSPAYDRQTLDALLLAFGGVDNYYTLVGQVDAFSLIFNNMMASILDDAAQKEGVTADGRLDSVSLATYKQYLASVMLSDSFRDYFANVAENIIIFNRVLEQMKQSSVLLSYQDLGKYDNFQAQIDKILSGLDKESNTYKAVLSYKEGKNPYAHDRVCGTSGLGGHDKHLHYSVEESNYAIRAAEDVNYSGQDVNALLKDLESERSSAINRFSIIGTQGNLDAIKAIDAKLFSIQKYLITQSFRDYVSAQTSNNINITINGQQYNVVLTLSTTQIAELAFGNQLKELAPEYYKSDDNFLFVEPSYGGVVKLDVKDGKVVPGVFISSFGELKNFLKKFGDIALELNKSNFVEIGADNTDRVYSTAFYDAFSNYIVKGLLNEFPDLARKIGLIVNESALKNLSSDQLSAAGYFKDLVDYDNGNYSYEVVSWNVNKVWQSKVSGKLDYNIKLKLAFEYNNKNGVGVTQIVEKVFTGKLANELGDSKYQDFAFDQVSYDAKSLVKMLIEYWGFEYEESKIGFTYPIEVVTNGGNVEFYVTIEGVRYQLTKIAYSGVADDNSLIVSSNINENTLSCLAIKYVNGKYYMADSDSEPKSVTIGGELVGKTLLDYRRDALLAIAHLETRGGETEDELKDRLLSMFYFLCASYQDLEEENGKVVKATLATNVFSKSLVKDLAGVLNRPDETLVEKTFSVELDSYRKDENNGTIFIICTYDKTLEKYVPFLVTNENSSKKEFYSRYIYKSNTDSKRYFPVVAKGIIDQNGNPTAIRENQDGNIEFYRDNVYIVNASNMGISIYYQSVEDIKVKNSFISTVVNGITKLFSGKTLTQMLVEKIPRVTADMTLNFAYGSRPTTVGSVKDGYIPMSYDFSVLGIDSFYSVQDLNIIILLSGTIMIVLAMFAAVWGLIQRIFDIVVLFLVAPPVIATIPIEKDDTSGKFVTWKDKMISSVLSVYGIVIGLNAFFLFVPYISSFDFFQPGTVGATEVMKNGIMRHFGDINFVNYLFKVMFLLTAIGLIRRAPKMFAPLINPGDEQDIFSKGEATQKNVRAAVDTVKDHVSGQYALDKAAKVGGTIKSMIPGSAIAEKGIQLAKKGKDKLQSKALELYARAHGVPKDVAKLAASNLNDKMQSRRKKKSENKEKQQKARDERDQQRAQR